MLAHEQGALDWGLGERGDGVSCATGDGTRVYLAGTYIASTMSVAVL